MSLNGRLEIWKSFIIIFKAVLSYQNIKNLLTDRPNKLMATKFSWVREMPL